VRDFTLHFVCSMVFIGVLSHSASGSEDTVRFRAQCAQLRVAEMMGTRAPRGVNPADCVSAPPVSGSRMVESARVDSEGYTSGTGAFGDVTRDIEARPPHGGPPDWLYRPPATNGVLYGVGTGDTQINGFRASLVMVAAQLEVEIRGQVSTVGRQEVSAETQNGYAVSSSVSESSQVSETSQMIVRGSLDGAEIQDVYLDPESGDYWVLSALDVGAIERGQDALVNSVMESLAQASERLIGATQDSGVIDQAALLAAVATIQDIETLGRTDIGRDVRQRWRDDVRAFKRVLKEGVDCVHLSGDFVTADGSVHPFESAPVLEQGSVIRLSVTCGETPMAGARLRTHVSGGLVQVPDTVYTDARGNVEIVIGAAFGQGMQLGLTHDFDGVAGAFWLGSLSPDRRRGQVAFRASRPASVGFTISGVNAQIESALLEEFAQLARREWGADVRESGALMTATARVRFGQHVQVRSMHSIPVEMDLNLSMSGGGGSLLNTTLRTGGVGDTEQEARANAVTGLGQRIARLRVTPALDPAVRLVVACQLPTEGGDSALQAAMTECIEYSSSYVGSDANAVYLIAEEQIRAGLVALEAPDLDPSLVTTESQAMAGLAVLRPLRRQCDSLLNVAGAHGDIRAVVANACQRNSRKQMALRSVISRITSERQRQEELRVRESEANRDAANANRDAAAAERDAANANREAAAAERARAEAEAQRARIEYLRDRAEETREQSGDKGGY
jgi:hypothetical protein